MRKGIAIGILSVILLIAGAYFYLNGDDKVTIEDAGNNADAVNSNTQNQDIESNSIDNEFNNSSTQSSSNDINESANLSEINQSNSSLSSSILKNSTSGANASSGTFLLAVVKQKSGYGKIISDPAGINCGGDCNQVVKGVVNYKLYANASSGSVFEGWSGGCTSIDSNNICYVTIIRSTVVYANFTT